MGNEDKPLSVMVTRGYFVFTLEIYSSKNFNKLLIIVLFLKWGDLLKNLYYYHL